MLLNRPSWNLAKFVIPAVLIFSTTYYLFQTSDEISLPGYQFTGGELVDGLGTQPPAKPPVVTKELLKQEFIQDVIDNEIDGPINLDPLSELCRDTQWQAGLIVKCQPVPGGIGNIRNMFLNCIRFAIEAGATGLVVPEGRHRNEKDLYDIHTEDLYHFSYLLDLDLFTRSFNTACPQVKLYQTDADLPASVTPETYFHLTPVDLAPKLQALTLIDMPRPEWRRAFDAWLRNDTQVPDFPRETPTCVYMTNCLLRWPFMYDTPEFVATFGRILRIREDMRRLAGAVLWAMSEQYQLDLDYSSGRIPEGKFMGAHLRTASDATKAGWPGYDSQETNYIHSANRTDSKLIYLTTGAPEDAKRFTKTAKSHGMTVISKDTLFQNKEFKKERKALEKMSWDQRALIDFEVLLRASYFVGMFESSFSWNIALRRHIVVGKGTWINIEPGKQGLDGLVDPAEAFIDQYSAVFGPVDLGIRWQFPMGLFP